MDFRILLDILLSIAGVSIALLGHKQKEKTTIVIGCIWTFIMGYNLYFVLSTPQLAEKMFG